MTTKLHSRALFGSEAPLKQANGNFSCLALRNPLRRAACS